MNDLNKPACGNNLALPEISPALSLRLMWIRERYGIAGPFAKAICDLALGYPIDGDSQ